MKVSLNWLKDYVDLNDISTGDIVDKLTTAGLEVDDVIDGSKVYDNFVVGYVKEKRKHPNADKLSVCIVNDGSGDYNVVCGAPNVEAGQKIAFAKVGAVIPNGNFKITKAKIRGEVSLGMICAEDELGLGDDHSGIIVLDENLKEGMPLAEALGLDDVVIDIDLTPNRADAASHIGVARDLAAIFDRQLKIPSFELGKSDFSSKDLAAIEIEDTENCPRYVGRVVKNVTIKESPEWLKKKLTGIGLRSINNVVDVTNFVLHEVGQPLHAFDLDKLAGQKIIVKDAGEGDKFVTLDSKERILNSDDLMICDAEKHVAIAGVMGGENSEVTAETKNILIESAYFNPSAIRKTSKKLGLSTDASYRFERGCDPQITVWAAERAAYLIGSLAGGEISNDEIDVYPKEIKHRQVDVRFSRIDKILGFTIDKKSIRNIFEKLEFDIEEESDEKLSLLVPTFRPDIEREIDLIEEVARIHGYNKIPAVEKISVALDEKIDQSGYAGKLRNILFSLGFNEIITNSLLNEETALKFGKAIKVMNPQSVEMAYTRPSLIPGTLSTISKNLKVKENNLCFFEIGHIFNLINEKSISDFNDFSETEHVLISITGLASEKNWYSPERYYDFYDLKGYVNSFLKLLHIDNRVADKFNGSDNDLFEFGFSKTFKKEIVGSGGKLNSKLLADFNIKHDVFIFDFDLSKIKKIKDEKNEYSELLKYPKVIRDFAFIIDKNIEVKTVIKTIYEGSTKLLKNIKLFDIFEGESLGVGKQSLAFQLEYYDHSRTLTEEEVDKEFWNAIDVVKKKLNAELRG